jgi:hypothetical protein
MSSFKRAYACDTTINWSITKSLREYSQRNLLPADMQHAWKKKKKKKKYIHSFRWKTHRIRLLVKTGHVQQGSIKIKLSL